MGIKKKNGLLNFIYLNFKFLKYCFSLVFYFSVHLSFYPHFYLIQKKRVLKFWTFRIVPRFHCNFKDDIYLSIWIYFFHSFSLGRHQENKEIDKNSCLLGAYVLIVKANYKNDIIKEYRILRWCYWEKKRTAWRCWTPAYIKAENNEFN